MFVLLLVLLVVGCGNDSGEHVGSDNDTNVVAADDTIADGITTEPDDQDTTRSGGTSRLNVTVATPIDGDRIDSDSIKVSGTARVFENTVSWRLVSANGDTLAHGFTTATGEMGLFSPYSTMIPTPQKYTGHALLEVYQASAKDGSDIDMNRVGIEIAGTGNSSTMAVQIFLPNIHMGSSQDCNRVFAVTRTIRRTKGVAQTALRELLQGPTNEERAKGYRSEIPAGATLRRVVIENGAATADFNSELNRVAGACRVTAITAQIESTLRQFPGVTSVIITVDGNTEGVLQP